MNREYFNSLVKENTTVKIFPNDPDWGWDRDGYVCAAYFAYNDKEYRFTSVNDTHQEAINCIDFVRNGMIREMNKEFDNLTKGQ